MALAPFWQPDPPQPRRALADWRGLLAYGVGGVVTVMIVSVLIAMIIFLILVFTADGDSGDASDARSIVGSPAGEQGIGPAVRDGAR